MQMAYGELGLKPWELRRLTWNEYHQMCIGFIRKNQREQSGLRKLYHLIYNANSKHPIRSAESLQRHWSLSLIDSEASAPEMDLEEVQARIKRALESNKRLKQRHDGRTKSNNNQ